MLYFVNAGALPSRQMAVCRILALLSAQQPIPQGFASSGSHLQPDVKLGSSLGQPYNL